jgi:hypothetical protein
VLQLGDFQSRYIFPHVVNIPRFQNDYIQGQFQFSDSLLKTHICVGFSILGEISCSHSSKYEDYSLLGYCVIAVFVKQMAVSEVHTASIIRSP